MTGKRPAPSLSRRPLELQRASLAVISQVLRVKMLRNNGDTWPDNVPVGTFDIEMGAPEGYAATAHIIFVCPNAHRCSVLLGPKFVGKTDENRLNVWGWDGNMESPTITPSINCIAEKDGKPTGGCGWHGHITNREMA